MHPIPPHVNIRVCTKICTLKLFSLPRFHAIFLISLFCCWTWYDWKCVLISDCVGRLSSWITDSSVKYVIPPSAAEKTHETGLLIAFNCFQNKAIWAEKGKRWNFSEAGGSMCQEWSLSLIADRSDRFTLHNFWYEDWRLWACTRSYGLICMSLEICLILNWLQKDLYCNRACDFRSDLWAAVTASDVLHVTGYRALRESHALQQRMFKKSSFSLMITHIQVFVYQRLYRLCAVVSHLAFRTCDVRLKQADQTCNEQSCSTSAAFKLY